MTSKEVECFNDYGAPPRALPDCVVNRRDGQPT